MAVSKAKAEEVKEEVAAVEEKTEETAEEEKKEKRKRRSYCIIDDDAQTITFVANKLTKKEQETIKSLIAIGYKAIRTTADEMYAPKEKIYTEENVKNFLKTVSEEAVAEFERIKEEPAIDKKTNVVKKYKNGDVRKKGYMGALRWFRATYEQEFLKSLGK